MGSLSSQNKKPYSIESLFWLLNCPQLAGITTAEPLLPASIVPAALGKLCLSSCSDVKMSWGKHSKNTLRGPRNRGSSCAQLHPCRKHRPRSVTLWDANQVRTVLKAEPVMMKWSKKQRKLSAFYTNSARIYAIGPIHGLMVRTAGLKLGTSRDSLVSPHRRCHKDSSHGWIQIE